MKQKIEVQVTMANNDQAWPKKFESYEEAAQNNSNWLVEVRGSDTRVLKMSGGGQWLPETFRDFSLGFQIDGIYGFDNFQSLMRWWAKPQPIKQEPEMCSVGLLDDGDCFSLPDGEVFRMTPIVKKHSSGSMTRYAISMNTGLPIVFEPNKSVAPFYGEITTKVSKD